MGCRQCHPFFPHQFASAVAVWRLAKSNIYRQRMAARVAVGLDGGVRNSSAGSRALFSWLLSQEGKVDSADGILLARQSLADTFSNKVAFAHHITTTSQQGAIADGRDRLELNRGFLYQTTKLTPGVNIHPRKQRPDEMIPVLWVTQIAAIDKLSLGHFSASRGPRPNNTDSAQFSA